MNNITPEFIPEQNHLYEVSITIDNYIWFVAGLAQLGDQVNQISLNMKTLYPFRPALLCKKCQHTRFSERYD
ncbi:MAG: hypothetical protein R2778_12775 [Saprospiraceae bacterium]